MTVMRVVSLVMAALCALSAVACAAFQLGKSADSPVWGRPKEPLTWENKDLDQKDWEAVCDANRSVEDCASAENFYLRGTLLYQVGRRERAADDFVKAITLDPAYRDKVRDFYHEDKHKRPVIWDGSCK